jgi:hypothetical protein
VRVAFQAIAGFAGAPFTLISSASAYLEIPAVFLFSVVIWRTLDAKPVVDQETGEITLESRVGAVLSRYPDLLAVFLRYGFTPLANPVLRRTLAAVVTIRQACEMHGIDAAALLRDLRGAAGQPPTGRRALRVIG